MKVLFTGYAPVHFACFKPLYDQLQQLPRVEVYLSGGTRTMSPFGVSYNPATMYGPFGLSAQAWLAVEDLKDLDVDVLVSAHTGRIEPRSFACSVQIFHGMSFRNLAIREDNIGFDYYFVIGPYMMRGFQKRGLFATADSRALPIGFPKTDRLVDGSLDRGRVLAELGLSGKRPVVLYAPTGAKDNSLETMGAELIERLRAEDAYDLLIKLHDHPKGWIDWFEHLSGYEGEHQRVVRTPDVIPLLHVADLLITDASSVANEYALLDRPIVFLDVPAMLEAARARGAMVDLDTWGRKGGEVVSDPASAVAAVAEGLADPGRHSAIRGEMVRDLFFNPGCATEAAMTWLRQELGQAGSHAGARRTAAASS